MWRRAEADRFLAGELGGGREYFFETYSCFFDFALFPFSVSLEIYLSA